MNNLRPHRGHKIKRVGLGMTVVAFKATVAGQELVAYSVVELKQKIDKALDAK